MQFLWWIMLGFLVQVFAALTFMHLIGKGRVLSRPLWRFPLFRPLWDPITGRILASNVRTMQVSVLTGLYIVVAFTVLFTSGLNVLVISAAYWIILISLYLDDYLTGDDDRWHRFRRRLRKPFTARTQPQSLKVKA